MDFVTPPWEHQKGAVLQSFQKRDLALLWEMGTGKTKTTIDILRGRYATYGRLLRTLVLAPPVVLKNWQREFSVHSRIDPRSIVVLRGSGLKRLTQLKSAVSGEHHYDKAAIVLTNYEALENKELFAILKLWAPEILVADESQRCKNFKSKRAIKVAELAEATKHNYILTGTPILNSSMDLYMQYRILDRGETFGKNFYAFRGMYFEDKNAGMPAHIHFPKWEPRPTAYQEFHSRVYRKGLRATKAQCLDLPPLIRTTREVEMNDEQNRMYKEMKDEFLTFIKTEENSQKPRAVVAQLAVTKALRLQQIVSGFAKDDQGQVHIIKNVPRLAVLRELLEEITGEGQKIIVWAVFKDNYRQIRQLCEDMGCGFAEVHGDISATEKEKSIQRFEKDPECKVMIANQAAGGIGVNMVAASYSIYYSKNFSYGDDAQSESRNHRGGSERHEKITRIDLVCPHTIDELVLEALRMKKNIGDIILDRKGDI